MKNIKNRFIKPIAVMISAVMLFCCADIKSVAASYFSGNITADEYDIPVGGITIDIYGSKLKYSANGLKRYEHYYSGTVTTDSSGGFSFLKPSGKTLLKVELDTLPDGVGVDSLTRLVSSRYDDTFILSRIEDIDIVKNNDGTVYRADLKAADGSLLFADCDITDNVSASFYDPTYETLNSVELWRTVTVSTPSVSKSRTFQIDMSHCTVPGKLSRLLYYGVIGENDVEEITGVFKEDTAPVKDPRPDFYNERTYTAGNFMLHSEEGTADIERYESILGEIVDVYFNKYDFLEPYHEFESGSSTRRKEYFHIYLVDPAAIRIESEVSPKNVVGRSVKIDPDDESKGCYIVLSPTDAESFKKTLSHEIFHGIIYRYTGKNVAGWFKESFSNYGSLLCLNGSTDTLNKQMGYYLKSPSYSLNNTADYRYRQYGITLLPLYIHNKLGGVKTIKNILTAYANSRNAYTAIDKGMRNTKSSYSFAALFAGFKDRNAFTEFYTVPDTSSGSSSVGIGRNALRTATFDFEGSYSAASPEMTLSGNSAAYFEYRAPSGERGKLTVTTETSEGVSDVSYNMILRGKQVVIPSRKKTSGLTTFVVSDLGGKINKAVLAAGNTSMSSANTVGFYVSAYFEEK